MHFFRYLKYRLSSIIKHNRALIGFGYLAVSKKNYSNIEYLSDVEVAI